MPIGKHLPDRAGVYPQLEKHHANPVLTHFISIKNIFSVFSAAAISLWDRIAAGNRKEEWITNRAGSLSFKVQVHQLSSGKWTSGILTRSGTFYGNHRFSSLKHPAEEFRSYRQARRFALKMANQLATLRFAYQ